MDSFSGKTVVVTGAASGIGAGLARAFAAEGASVFLADIADGEPVAAAIRDGGGDATFVRTDVTKRESVEALADAAWARSGRVDVVCNNAGVVGFAPVWETPVETWQRLLGVNVQGVINGVSVFVPRLLSQGGESHVVNTASGAGLLAGGPLPTGAYATSKFAVVGLSESLRAELADRGIGVTILCPGSVATGILDSADYTEATTHLRPATAGAPTPGREMVRRMAPDDVAQLVLDGVRKNRPYVITHPEMRDAIVARMEAQLAACDETAEALKGSR